MDAGDMAVPGAPSRRVSEDVRSLLADCSTVADEGCFCKAQLTHDDVCRATSTMLYVRMRWKVAGVARLLDGEVTQTRSKMGKP